MTREIVVNGRFLARPVTGVERYGREILSLFRTIPRVERTRLTGPAAQAWEQVWLPVHLSPRSVLWSPANIGPISVRNQALTIHDLSPLEHPEWYSKSFALWYRLAWPVLARRVKIIFAPSLWVRQKIERQFAVENVLVTPNGVDVTRFHPGVEPGRLAIPKPYILFVGSVQPRKNLAALLRAWQALRLEFPAYTLVVAGARGNVFNTTSLRPAEGVLFTGYVAEADLPGLYAGAALFVLPAFDEGCGLPALEAMACGVPVLVSNGGALPETVGEAAVVFDLQQPNDLPLKLRACLSDARLRADLRTRGLARAQQARWQTTAALIESTLHEL